MKKFLGFTLAEALITLSVIGILAAMTLPSLNYKFKERRNAIRLQHTYSTLKQAMAHAIMEGEGTKVININTTAQMENWFNKQIAPYLKYTKTCKDSNNADCWAAQTYADGSNFTNCQNTSFSFVLNDGVFVCINDWGKDDVKNKFGINNTDLTYSVSFYFDINGENPPNIFGKDVFTAMYTGSDFVPAGKDKSASEVKANCSTSGDGLWCLQRAIDKGFEFPLY